MYIYHILFIHSSADGHLELFPPYCESAALNMEIQVSVPIPAFKSPLGIYPKVESLDDMVILTNIN